MLITISGRIYYAREKVCLQFMERYQKINNFLLFNFSLFSYRQRVISKHLALPLTYVLVKSNLKLAAAFLTMRPVILKFEIF